MEANQEKQEQIIENTPAPESTQVFKPMSEFNAMNPEAGVSYIKDEEYAKLQAPKEEVVVDTPPTGEPVVTPPAIDYDSIVKEKTGGKFEKWDDLQKRLDSPVEFADEQSKLVYEYLKEGKTDDVGTYLTLQKILSNVDKMSDEEVIKLKMRHDDPDADDEDIDYAYSKKYVAPETEGMDDADAAREKKIFDRSLKKASQADREFLTGLKKDIKLPALPAPDAPPFITIAELQEKTNEYSKNIVDSVDKILPGFNILDLSIKDKDVQFEIKHQITDQEKVELKKKAASYHNLQDRYASQDGSIDGEKVAREMYILDNLPKIIKAAVTNALTQGELKRIQSIAQVDLALTPAPSTDFAADKRKQEGKAFILA